MRMPGGRASRLLLTLCAAALLAGRAGAQGLGAWFDRDSAAGDYAAIAGRARELAAKAARDGVPERLLEERLAEGARKRVSPERLAAALEEEEARLAEVASLLDGIGLGRDRPREAQIAAGGLLRRAGASPALLAAALAAARLPPGAAAAGPAALADRAFAAVAATVSVNARFPLAEPAMARLAAALAAGGLRDDRFPSLVSVFARGKASGLATERIAEICSSVLEGGGSIERMESEIQRRTRKP